MEYLGKPRNQNAGKIWELFSLKVTETLARIFPVKKQAFSLSNICIESFCFILFSAITVSILDLNRNSTIII